MVDAMIRLRTLLLLSVFLAGCSIYRAPALVVDYGYYINPDKDLYDIGRVTIVELNNDSSYPQISADVTRFLFQELQKKQVFGLTLVRRSDPVWHSLQLDLDSKYTLEQLLIINKTLKCDALLIGTVTQYQPYPQMAIGLRLKLIDLSDGQLLWALEQIWDCADKVTEYRIKKHFRSQTLSGAAPLSEQLLTVSPLKFIKFVAWEVAGTM